MVRCGVVRCGVPNITTTTTLHSPNTTDTVTLDFCAVRDLKYNDVLDEEQGLERHVEARILLAVNSDLNRVVRVDDQAVVAVVVLEVKLYLYGVRACEGRREGCNA